MTQPPVSYKRRRFPPDITAHAVWLYFRFPLMLRLVEEMPLERGVVVSCETVRCRAMTFGAGYVSRLRRKTPGQRDVWPLDEGAVSINGEKRCPWRAVDRAGAELPRSHSSARAHHAGLAILAWASTLRFNLLRGPRSLRPAPLPPFRLRHPSASPRRDGEVEIRGRPGMESHETAISAACAS